MLDDKFDKSKEILRVCGDYKDENMLKVVDLLRSNGFRMTVSSCSGILPEVRCEPYCWKGIHEIEKFVLHANKGEVYQPSYESYIQ